MLLSIVILYLDIVSTRLDMRKFGVFARHLAIVLIHVELFACCRFGCADLRGWNRPTKYLATVFGEVAAIERIELTLLPRPLHVLVGGDVETRQIRVEAAQAHHGPHGEEGDEDDERRGPGDGHGLDQVAIVFSIEIDHVNERKDENVTVEQRERDEENVEVAIIAPPNTISHPRAVMIKALDAIVTNRTVRRSRRPIDFASVAILKLNRHTRNLNLLFAGRRPVALVASRCAFFILGLALGLFSLVL